MVRYYDNFLLKIEDVPTQCEVQELFEISVKEGKKERIN